LNKAPDAFRTISEVADELDLPQHVLRFWESRFPHIKPMKRGGGRRYYRPEDVDLLRGIRHLLYADGYTIRGVQRILREQGVRTVQSVGQGLITLPEPGPEDDAAPMVAAADRHDPPLSSAPSAGRNRQYGGGEGHENGEENDKENGQDNSGALDDGDPDRGNPDGEDLDSSDLKTGAAGEHNAGHGEPKGGGLDHTDFDPGVAVHDASPAVAIPSSPSRARHPAASRGSPPAPPAANTPVAAPGTDRGGIERAGMAPLDLERLKTALAELEAARRLLERAIEGA
jgi:DNA-binding transcriptional MerR regulator